jgi:thiamine pyrophosphokinase
MRAIVAAGGEPLDDVWRTELAADALVIAADSGLAHVYALGRTPHVVVGDFDSVDPDHLEQATTEGARIERHPADKDATDLELALEIARQLGATEVTVIGAGGGRLDHLLTAMTLLAAPEWAEMRIEAFAGPARLTVVHDHADLVGAIGSLVTLLVVGAAATGITTTGLRWPLVDENLAATSTRGVSNEITASPATVTVGTGTLLAIQPTGGR